MVLGNDADPTILVVVTEIYVHPLFDPSFIAHDLAVVETHDEIPFSSSVGPACLPFKHVNNNFVGDIVKVLGEFFSPCYFIRCSKMHLCPQDGVE